MNIMIDWMNLPTNRVASPTVIEIPEKLIPPSIIPSRGVMISDTSELTIAVNAPPMMIPTAILITLPLLINSLNSLIKPFTKALLSTLKLPYKIRSQN